MNISHSSSGIPYFFKDAQIFHITHSKLSNTRINYTVYEIFYIELIKCISPHNKKECEVFRYFFHSYNPHILSININYAPSMCEALVSKKQCAIVPYILKMYIK